MNPRCLPFYFSILFVFLFDVEALTQETKPLLTKGTVHNIIAPGETILSIHQDQNGDYWFGTNGVYHFDGKDLTHYTTEDGLIGNQVRGIQEDDAGNLYFDTPDGVSKFDGQSFKWLRPIYKWENEWKSEPGDLWFKQSGDNNAVYRYDGEKLFQLELPEKDLEEAFGFDFGKPHYSPYGLYSIYKDKQRNLWFGTLSAGVYRFDGESFDWIAEPELTTLEDGRVPGVRSIIEDKEGNFWLSNILNRYEVEDSGGRFEYERLDGIDQTGKATKMEFPYFMSAVTDDDTGDLWMVTYSEGVWRYDGENLKQYKIMDGATEVLLYCIYKDRQGNLFVGTHGHGVWQFDGETFKKFLVSE